MALRGGVRFKADDIWDTPDDGNRYEVIDGDLYVTPPPVERHQFGAGNLYGYLWHYVRQRRIGRVYFAPVGVVLDEENALQPDLVYVSNERNGIVVERGIEGSPDLVVEILSPSTQGRDRGVKMRRYAAAGIPNYWILDPRTRTVEEYELGDEGYRLTASVGPDSVFRPRLFPELEIPVEDLWK